jgi:hypothetical protein
MGGGGCTEQLPIGEGALRQMSAIGGQILPSVADICIHLFYIIVRFKLSPRYLFFYCESPPLVFYASPCWHCPAVCVSVKRNRFEAEEYASGRSIVGSAYTLLHRQQSWRSWLAQLTTGRDRVL